MFLNVHPELSKHIQEQVQQPLAFMSGKFSNSNGRWSPFELEAFSVVQAFRKLYFLLMCYWTTNIFTDYLNFIFTFNPAHMDTWTHPLAFIRSILLCGELPSSVLLIIRSNKSLITQTYGQI